MTLFCKNNILIFFILFSSQFLLATRWPFIIIDDNKSFLESSKRRIIRSPANIKRVRRCECVKHIFQDKKLFDQVIISNNSLEELFNSAPHGCTTKVRVLLARVDTSEAKTEWSFSCPQGIIVQYDDATTKTKKIMRVPHLVIMIKKGIPFLYGKKIHGVIRINPIAGYGECNGITYDGDFCVMPHKDSLLCINQVALEDYITAVLRTESWPGWSLEVNKVFAIACRSYVAYKLLEAKRSGRPFHVKNSNAHQTYKGRHDVGGLKIAVDQTRGMVLGFAGKPILAMFDCCCGGVIPAHITDFDFSQVPYLARTYACTHCNQFALYSWQVVYEHAKFEAQIKQYCHDIVRLSDIQVIQRDKAGLVLEVKLKGPKNTAIISGKKLYSLLKEIKSFHFDVQRKSGKITFTGRGFGHHIGLCQWGAHRMVSDGWDYKSILRFYYPGTYFMHLI